MDAPAPPLPPPFPPPTLARAALPAEAGAPQPVTYVIQPAPAPVRWRDRPLLWIAAAAAALTAVAFALGPWLSYNALRSAARYDDASALAQLVDYDAMRASLRPQLIDPVGAPAAPPAPNPLTNPLGALQNAWANRAWAPAVRQAPSPDAYLSPDALTQVLAGKGEPRTPPKASSPRVEPAIVPRLVYFGARRVRFVVRDPADRSRETVLVMARQHGWFEWRLVGLVLPRPAPAAAPAPGR